MDCNLKFLCKELDAASGLSERSKPTLAQLSSLFKEKGVQSLIGRVLTTKKGRESRIDQIAWDTLARKLRKELKYPVTPGSPQSALKRKRKTPSLDDETTTISHPETPVRKKTKKPTKKANSVKYEKSSRSPSKLLETINVDDAEVELIFFSQTPPRKNRRDRPLGTRNPGFTVLGPNPKLPREGAQRVICNDDTNGLTIQGSMMNGTVTTAYFNTLVRDHYGSGVRRVHDSFLYHIREEQLKHGSYGGFQRYVASDQDAGVTDVHLDWKEDPLIFVQVFRGLPDYGHWILCVIDRVTSPEDLVIVFDSLPAYAPDTPEVLQRVFTSTPLDEGGRTLKFIVADTPLQGRGTNDCGAWMSMFAGLYLKTVLDQGSLASRRRSGIVSTVSVVTDPNTDAVSLGSRGRHHIMESIRNDCCDLDRASLFNQMSLQWS